MNDAATINNTNAHTSTPVQQQGLASPDAPAVSGHAASATYTLAWACRLGRHGVTHGLPSGDRLAASFTGGGGVQVAMASATLANQHSGFVAQQWVQAVTNQLMPLPLSRDFCEGSLEATQHALAKVALAGRLMSARSTVEQALQTTAPGAAGAATTVGAWLGPNGLGLLSHVGDCRAYHYRVYQKRNTWVQADHFSYAQKGVLDKPQIILNGLTHDETYFNLRENPPPGLWPSTPARMVGLGSMHAPPPHELRAATCGRHAVTVYPRAAQRHD